MSFDPFGFCSALETIVPSFKPKCALQRFHRGSSGMKMKRSRIRTGRLDFPVRYGNRFADLNRNKIRTSSQLRSQTRYAENDQSAKLLHGALLPRDAGWTKLLEDGLNPFRNRMNTFG